MKKLLGIIVVLMLTGCASMGDGQTAQLLSDTDWCLDKPVVLGGRYELEAGRYHTVRQLGEVVWEYRLAFDGIQDMQRRPPGGFRGYTSNAPRFRTARIDWEASEVCLISSPSIGSGLEKTTVCSVATPIYMCGPEQTVADNNNGELL